MFGCSTISGEYMPIFMKRSKTNMRSLIGSEFTIDSGNHGIMS